jgi:hypothetical protein
MTTVAVSASKDRMDEGPQNNIAFNDCTGDVFRRRILDHGYIILRGAVPAAQLVQFRQHFVEPALEWYSSLSDQELEQRVRPSWWGAGGDLGFHRNQRDRAYVSDGILQDFTEGAASFYDLVSDDAFSRLMTQAFPETEFHKSLVCLCRRIAPGEPIRGWGFPTVFHIDLRYHQETLFALNFWTPLDPAGAAYRSPGIEIVDMGLKDVAKWLEFTLSEDKMSGDFNAERFDFDRFAATHGTDRVSQPDLAPGDILVFSNFALHRTHIPPSAAHSRLSAEIRFVGESAVTLATL